MPEATVNGVVSYLCDLCGCGNYVAISTDAVDGQYKHMCSIPACGHLKSFTVIYPHTPVDSGSTEYWRMHREESKSRKQANRDRAVESLNQYGVLYQEHNGGIHLIIMSNHGGKIDYWPTTGLWSDRDKKIERRGINSLLKHLGVKTNVSDVQDVQPDGAQ